MAYCSKCGAEVQGNFCSNCGHPVNVYNHQKNNDANIHMASDVNYTNEDLRMYENKLKADILNAEKHLKKHQKSIYIGLTIIAVAIIHWYLTTGFVNALITGIVGIYGMLFSIISGRTRDHSYHKLAELKQYNAYSYMMKHKADEEKLKAIGNTLQAINQGARTYNTAYQIGQFLGRL